MLPAGRLVRVTRASIQTSVVQAQQHQRGELHPRRDQRAPLRADPFVWGRGTARGSTHLGHLPPAPSELSLKELISQIVSSEAQGCARKKKAVRFPN